MRRIMLILALILSISLSVASGTYGQSPAYYKFHCEGEDALCGGNLTGNYTLYTASPSSKGLPDLNSSNMKKADRSDIARLDDINRTRQENKSYLTSLKHRGLRIDVRYIEQRSHRGYTLPSNHHFYPKSDYSKSDFRGLKECYRADIEEIGDFYRVDLKPAFEEWYCIEGPKKFPGDVSPNVIDVRTEWG